MPRKALQQLQDSQKQLPPGRTAAPTDLKKAIARGAGEDEKKHLHCCIVLV